MAEEVNWELVHEERKQRRKERWEKYLPEIMAIAIVRQRFEDHYRITLPEMGWCDYFVSADKLKPEVSGQTYMNGFKIILHKLGLYIFEGTLKEKDF